MTNELTYSQRAKKKKTRMYSLTGTNLIWKIKACNEGTVEMLGW